MPNRKDSDSNLHPLFINDPQLYSRVGNVEVGDLLIRYPHLKSPLFAQLILASAITEAYLTHDPRYLYTVTHPLEVPSPMLKRMYKEPYNYQIRVKRAKRFWDILTVPQLRVPER